MRWQTTVGLVVLAVLAASTGWWLSGANTVREYSASGRGPAWYFDGARFSASGESGIVLYRVEAPTIVQDPNDGSAVLESPELYWIHGDAPPLLMTAARARAAADGRRMEMSGDVTIVDESARGRFEFHAPDLVVDADRRIAYTASEVIVRSAAGEITGIGLLADMNAGTIRIESSVRGRYAH